MELAWYIYVIAFFGALLAGGINTLAGNGSMITLSILTELAGLPGNIANGTNRIGVLMNGIGGTLGFLRGGKLDIRDARPVLFTVVLGAIAGALIALNISDAQFMWIFKVLMVCMLIVILVKPSRWMRKEKGTPVLPRWVRITLWFLLGVYGGLIQMGMGIFFLGVAVLASRYPIIRANAIKVAAVTIYTFFVVIMFQYRGLMDWSIGLVMGAGQLAGGWYTAKFASHHPAAEKWAYYCLVLIAVASLLSVFDLI